MGPGSVRNRQAFCNFLRYTTLLEIGPDKEVEYDGSINRINGYPISNIHMSEDERDAWFSQAGMISTAASSERQCVSVGRVLAVVISTAISRNMSHSNPMACLQDA